LIDSSGTVSHGSAVWFSEVHTPLQHYLIVARGRKGLELPDILSDSGEELLRGGGTGVPLLVLPREEMVCQGLLLRGTGLGSLCLSCENRGSSDRSAPWSPLGRRGGICCGATCFREFTARNPKPPTCRRCTSLVSDPSHILESDDVTLSKATIVEVGADRGR
jgi:hypothetical protein